MSLIEQYRSLTWQPLIGNQIFVHQTHNRSPTSAQKVLNKPPTSPLQAKASLHLVNNKPPTITTNTQRPQQAPSDNNKPQSTLTSQHSPCLSIFPNLAQTILR